MIRQSICRKVVTPFRKNIMLNFLESITFMRLIDQPKRLVI
jgi:hypothetical protein